MFEGFFSDNVGDNLGAGAYKGPCVREVFVFLFFSYLLVTSIGYDGFGLVGGGV